MVFDSLFNRKGVAVAALGVVASLISVHPANASVALNVNPATGVNSLTINGVEQIALQEFFYRLGSTGGQNSFYTGSATTTTINGPGSFTITYTNPKFKATVNYLLAGGNGPTDPVTLNENVSFANLTAGTEALHLFDYTDFNLGGQSSPQSVVITGTPPNTANQFNSSFTVTSDTVAQGRTGSPNEVQASVGPALLAAISSTTTPETLNNTLAASAGDVNFAFEYDSSVATGGTFQIGVPTTITAVPEPASLGLLAVGSVFMARRRRKA